MGIGLGITCQARLSSCDELQGAILAEENALILG